MWIICLPICVVQVPACSGVYIARCPVKFVCNILFCIYKSRQNTFYNIVRPGSPFLSFSETFLVQ